MLRLRHCGQDHLRLRPLARGLRMLEQRKRGRIAHPLRLPQGLSPVYPARTERIRRCQFPHHPTIQLCPRLEVCHIHKRRIARTHDPKCRNALHPVHLPQPQSQGKPLVIRL